MKYLQVVEVILVFVLKFRLILAQKDSPSNNTQTYAICTNMHTIPEYQFDIGLSSTLSLSLKSLTNSTCRVHISVPDSHVLHIRLVDTQQEKKVLEQAAESSGIATSIIQQEEFDKETQDCLVQVFKSKDESPSSAWSVDACSKTIPSDGSLIASDIDITWSPPSFSDKNFSKILANRKIIVTALGRGKICQAQNQHTCIQVGWTPLVCVSDELLCDGIVHCPPGALLGDEDPQFCRERQILSATNWERLATEFLKKFGGKPKLSSGLLPAIEKDSDEKWSSHAKGSSSSSSHDDHNGAADDDDSFTTPTTSMDSISSALSHYGPWGYLMLGMLICGTVLTFCGLWECCCKRSKALPPYRDRTRVLETPTASTALPSAVLVMEDEEAPPPPKYEELDQPPSYSMLFPGGGGDGGGKRAGRNPGDLNTVAVEE